MSTTKQQTHTHKPSTANKALFTALRLADPLLQYCIFKKGWGNALFLGIGLKSSTPVIGVLSPRQTLLVAFAAGAALRQVYWFCKLNSVGEFVQILCVGVMIANVDVSE